MKQKIKKVDEVRIGDAALKLILGASKSLHPREFIGLLRGSDNTIRHVVVIPKSTYGNGFAQVNFLHVPMDKTIIGSVHSHPTKDNKPSKTDLTYFQKKGEIHLIVGYPYENIGDIACYGRGGEKKGLKKQ